jgi:two-component system, chemotaxis family, chemotaxis protein CheY
MEKVLIVDDSSFTRRVHTKIFEAAGYEVVQRATGMGAIEAYSLDKPRVVLLDLSMEDLGGLEVLKTILQLDPQARVIVISADVQRSTEQTVLNAGAAKFFGKPANEQQLLAAVAELT